MNKLIEEHIHNLSKEDFEIRSESIEFLINNLDKRNYKKIVSFLESDDAIQRNAAIEILSRIGEPVVNEVIEVTKSKIDNLKIYSSNILGEIKSPKAISALLTLLEDEEANIRFAAAEAIGKIGSKEATMPLLHYLYARQDDPWEQFPLILALGQLQDERSVIPLLQLTENELLRQPIIQAISTIADEHALSYIIDLLLVSNDEFIESNSLIAVKNIKDKVAKFRADQDSFEYMINKYISNLEEEKKIRLFEILNKNIENEDFSIKIGSIVLLGFIYDNKSIDLLLKNNIDDLEFEIRDSLINIAKNKSDLFLNYIKNNESNQDLTIYILGTLEIEESKDFFISKLSSNKTEIRLNSIKALLKYKDDKHLEYIFNMLINDTSEDIKTIIIESLKDFSYNDVKDFLNKSNLDEVTKVRIILSLKNDINQISKYYQLKEVEIRKNVAEVLKKYSKEDEKDVLLHLLKDENHLVRESAIRTIEYKQVEISEYFSQLINDESDWVRYYLAKSLYYHSIDDTLIKTLIKLLTDKTPFVRISALESISNIKDLDRLENNKPLFEQISKILVQLINEDDSDISQAAISAFANINYDNEKFSIVLKEKFNDKDWLIRKSVASALKMSLDVSKSYLLLNEMLESENENLVMIEILKSLSEIYNKSHHKHEIINTLINYSNNDKLREYSIEILSSMDSSIVGTLQNIFDVSEVETKLNIISVFTNFANEKSLQMLIKISSNDSSPKVRKHAILSLSNFKSHQRAMWAIMWAANHDQDTFVSQSAKSILSQKGA
ncbi:MAG: HEAT repeat domain-containing protein [Candidatus Sericytochromatia bacterium]